MLVRARGYEIDVTVGQSIFVSRKKEDGTDESSVFLDWNQVMAFDQEFLKQFVAVVEAGVDMLARLFPPDLGDYKEEEIRLQCESEAQV